MIFIKGHPERRPPHPVIQREVVQWSGTFDHLAAIQFIKNLGFR